MIRSVTNGGGYYPTGGFICNVLNKSRKDNDHNIRCTVESTGGSVANMRSIQIKDLEVGIAMSAWQYHSWNGTDQFEEDGKNENLRFLFSLHADAAHIVVGADSGIEDFAGLEGKVVNTGNAGSGTEAQVYEMLGRYDLSADSFFKQETKLTSKEQAHDVVYNMVKAVFDDFEAFKAQSPMYNAVQIETAATAGQSAPYHPGAEQYFKEVGLLK